MTPFDRYFVRVLEIGQSSRIVRQALDSLPTDHGQGGAQAQASPPARC